MTNCRNFMKLCAAGLLSAGVASGANAGVIAMADLTITGFGLVAVTDDGPAPLTEGLAITADARTGVAGASLNGVEATGAGNSSINSNTVGASVDVANRCIGDCAAVEGSLYGGNLENDTSTHVATIGGGTYALGDMFVEGQIIGATGAQGLTRANVSIDEPTNSGGANSTILNGAAAQVSADFVAIEDLNVALAISYDYFVKTALGALESTESGIASAGINFQVSVTSASDNDFTPLFFAPGILNQGFTVTDSLEDDGDSGIGTLLSAQRSLKAGETYRLNITQASNASASLVPVPGTVLLLGLGLLGLSRVRGALGNSTAG